MPRILVTATIGVAIVVAIGLAGPAARADDVATDGPTAAELAALGWSQPPPHEQLARIDQPLPAGRGGVFVPAITDPDVEPHFQVRVPGGATVARAPSGTRVALAPGRYEVLVGSDPLQTGRARVVDVTEGRTTVVPVDWCALRVQVVDTNAVPFRGAYELIRLPALESVGVGYGASVELGQRLQTWILEPGLYMLLRRGESYRAREDFFTVRLRPGHAEEFMLVVDPETGWFRGAGEVGALTGSGTEVQEDLTLNWVVGGGVGLDYRRGVPGAADTTELVPSLYSDFRLSWAPNPHYVYLRIKLDEEWTQVDWERFEKEMDLLRLDALYAYEVRPWIGPYVRAGLETSPFPSWLLFDEPTTVVDASDPATTLGDGDSFRIADPFSPLTVKAGGGLRFDAELPPVIEFWALGGIGGRQVFTSGVFEAADDPLTTPFEVRGRGWSGDVGLEATLFLELNPVRWLLVSVEFDVFGPFRALENPTLRLDAEVGLRVTSVVGVVYSVLLERRPAVSAGLQQTHGLVLRFSFSIF